MGRDSSGGRFFIRERGRNYRGRGRCNDNARGVGYGGQRFGDQKSLNQRQQYSSGGNSW